MPIYEYECERCAHRFDLLQRFTDPPPETCPECAGPLRKLLFPPTVIFKGSGFYATEYGRGKSNGAAAAGAEKSETKTESKEGDAKPKEDSSKPKDTASCSTAT
ncbi:MAG: hypothetical protein HY815_02240 [Candidatus Riflebacteria bacterium]|nr:hypothetical protein [Candidatus Riflebacteria bacterium]